MQEKQCNFSTYIPCLSSLYSPTIYPLCFAYIVQLSSFLYLTFLSPFSLHCYAFCCLSNYLITLIYKTIIITDLTPHKQTSQHQQQPFCPSNVNNFP